LYVRDLRQERGIATHAEEIFHSPTSFVAGNPKGDMSVVAFLDCDCPYCRKGAPDRERLGESDGRVRLVLKELPVLGKDSEGAARIAVAAIPRGLVGGGECGRIAAEGEARCEDRRQRGESQLRHHTGYDPRHTPIAKAWSTHRSQGKGSWVPHAN
jgi:hypothetical protein